MIESNCATCTKRSRLKTLAAAHDPQINGHIRRMARKTKRSSVGSSVTAVGQLAKKPRIAAIAQLAVFGREIRKFPNDINVLINIYGICRQCNCYFDDLRVSGHLGKPLSSSFFFCKYLFIIWIHKLECLIRFNIIFPGSWEIGYFFFLLNIWTFGYLNFKKKLILEKKYYICEFCVYMIL